MVEVYFADSHPGTTLFCAEYGVEAALPATLTLIDGVTYQFEVIDTTHLVGDPLLYFILHAEADTIECKSVNWYPEKCGETTPPGIVVNNTAKSVDIYSGESMSSIDFSTATWNEVKPLLEDGTIGSDWWSLAESDRRRIAELAIKNTIFHEVHLFRSGKSNCSGGVGDFSRAYCQVNALIRVLQFGSGDIGGDSCYYKQNASSAEHCYVPAKKYNLPCHLVSCFTSPGTSPPFGHALAAIQVVNGVGSLDNWIVFQYNNFDLKSGEWQMPAPDYDNMYVQIKSVDSMSDTGEYKCTDYAASNIAYFDIKAESSGILHIITAPTGGSVYVGDSLKGVVDTYSHTIPAGETRDKVAVKIMRKHFKDKLFKKTLRSGMHEYALYRLSPAHKLKGKTQKSKATNSVKFTFGIYKTGRDGAKVFEGDVALTLLNQTNGQTKTLVTAAHGSRTITISYDDAFFVSGKQKLVCIMNDTADRIRTFRTITISKVAGDTVDTDEDWQDEDDDSDASVGKSIIDDAYAKIT